MTQSIHKFAVFFFVVMLSLQARGQTRPEPQDKTLPAGKEGLGIPPDRTMVDVTPRTLVLIDDLQKKESGPFRVRLVRDLGQCDVAALPYLLPLLADGDPLIRAEAARSVANIKDPSALPALKPLISDAVASVRREGVFAAAKLGSTEDVTAALDDTDEDVAAAALESAISPGQAEHIAGRFAKLSPRLRTIAAKALGRIGVAAHADVILTLLKSDALDRAVAIEAIGQMKATGKLEQVNAALNDPHPTVRRAAIAAMGQLATTEAQQAAAMRALDDPDPSVRQAAAVLLKAVPTAAALPALGKQLPTDYPPLHDEARLAMAAVGTAAIPVGAELLDNSDPRRREDGSFILGALASNEKIARHIALLADADYGVATQAARSMYRIAPPAADVGPQLIQLLNRADKAFEVDAGEAAILAAGRVRYVPIVERSVPLIPRPPPKTNWPPYAWRQAGIWAIGVTAEPGNPVLKRVENIVSGASRDESLIFESIKAMVNANDRNHVDAYKDWATSEVFRGGAEASRWMAHYAYDKFNGTTTPYVPLPPTPVAPDLAIVDKTGR